MAFFNLSFVFGLWILLYLASFVFFALLRITTGISIQRVGYLSLRRIAYTPRDGVKIEIRSLGLLLHRPTFARPTWLSLQLEELQVIVDLKAVGGPDAGSPSHENSANGAASHSSLPRLPKAQDASSRSQTWARLTQIKDRLKRAHRRIHWLRVLDLVATDSTITILEVGHVQIGSFTAAVDVRSKIIQRTRLFHHEPSPSHNQCPVEWMFTMRSAFLKPDGKESVEIIDLCSLNVHGILYQDLNGLRDARVALKFGRVYIPYDDLRMCAKQAQYSRSIRTDDDDFPKKFHSKSEDVKLLDAADARADHIMQTVSDSKEFVTSILRGIKEVQFARWTYTG
ncbi:MAG: hypothetical protein M1826_001732 [Phylliscum demangeonii]|nr:MAG: hypothetical protein M1826_001732 [Phylliscum demangeonii]